jgi:flagellar biogenesis protein FliO
MRDTKHTSCLWGTIRAAFVAGIAILASPGAAADADRPIQRPSAADTSHSLDESTGGAAIPAPAGSLTGDAVRTVVALGAVLALALVMRQVAKRFTDPLSARRPSGVVQILSRFPVGKGQTVQLLAIGTRVLCVHHSAGRMTTLCEFTDPQEIALLRTRIEAGSAGRRQFENELVRSLERDGDTLESSRRAADTQVANRYTPTETVDLTKRRPPAQRGGPGFNLVGGGRP